MHDEHVSLWDWSGHGRLVARRKSFISLFSGCGGLDCGFVQAGFRPIAAFDQDPFAVKSYNLNLGAHATQFDLRKWPELRNLSSEKADVLVAGPPCQGFSPPGTRNPMDDRNKLLLVPIRLGTALGIPLIVVENVPGLLMDRYVHLRHRLEALLTKGGYRWQFLNFSAAEVGLPQLRKRVVLVASLGTVDLRARRSVGPGAPGCLGEALTMNKPLGNHVPKLLDPKGRYGMIARHIGEGQKLCNVSSGPSAVHTWQIPEVFGPVTRTEAQFLDLMIRLRRRNRRRDNGEQSC